MKNVDERFKNFKIEDFLFGNGKEIANRKKTKAYISRDAI